MSSGILTSETQQVNPSMQHQYNGTQQSVDPTNGNPSKLVILPRMSYFQSDRKALLIDLPRTQKSRYQIAA